MTSRKSVNNQLRKESQVLLSQHIEQQPKSVRTLHQWMKILELIDLVGGIGTFIVAVYVSLTWKNFETTTVMLWWVIFAAVAALFGVLLGLHAIILKAYPPVIMPNASPFLDNIFSGNRRMLVTGQQAMRWGGFLIGIGFAWGAIGIGFYCVVLYSNFGLLRVLTGLITVLFLIVIILSFVQRASREKSK